MSKNIQTALCLVIGLAVIAFVASSSVTHAQRTLTGEWKASIKEDPNRINLHFERHTESGNRNQMGQTFAGFWISGFSGLSPVHFLPG